MNSSNYSSNVSDPTNTDRMMMCAREAFNRGQHYRCRDFLHRAWKYAGGFGVSFHEFLTDVYLSWY